MALAPQALLDSRSFAALKRFQKVRDRRELCEICDRPLGEDHAHLIEIGVPRIACACDACALLFDGPAQPKYRRIPRDMFRLLNLRIDDVDWESLSIPIGLAFFFVNSSTQSVVAVYPSPGGPVRAELEEKLWGEIASRHMRLRDMASDVEALLVNRLNGRSEYYLAPIDRCYELTGLIRKHWTGFGGGDEVWREVERFFARCDERAIVVGAAHARSAL
jgi:hypothetical protein